MGQLDEVSQRALDAKISIYRTDVQIRIEDLEDNVQSPKARGLFGPNYDDVSPGAFFGLEMIRLRWTRPDWFEFIPKAGDAFRFVRSNGQSVEPRRMFTDGGSIPRILWVRKNLSPWGFAPAFLLHDWEFDLHHCNRTDKSFEDVRDTMMEGIKTLMETGLCPRDKVTFNVIYAGIDSSVARDIWNRQHPDCPLPPDRAE